MLKKIDKNQPVTYSELEKLLTQQTTVILDGINKIFNKINKKSDKKLDKINKKLNPGIEIL